jgi:hypothetical protein
MKKDAWLAVSSTTDTRARQGKDSIVLYDGKAVPKSRVQKETRRHQRRENNMTNTKRTSQLILFLCLIATFMLNAPFTMSHL